MEKYLIISIVYFSLDIYVLSCHKIIDLFEVMVFKWSHNKL